MPLKRTRLRHLVRLGCLQSQGRGFCRSSEYAAVKESFDEKYARQQAVLKQLQPSVLIEALAEAAGAADRESDEVGPF